METGLEQPPPRPRHGLKIAAIGAVAVLAVAGSTFFVVRWSATVRHAQADKLVRALVEEAKSRPAARPVMRGEAVPGNAWDDYRPALAQARALKPDSGLLESFAEEEAVDRAAVKAVLAKCPEALPGLRRGARKAEGQYPYEWHKGIEADSPGLLEAQLLGHVAVAHARFLREDGDAREAIAILLDLAMFSRDLAYNGSLISAMIGTAVMNQSFEELRDMLGSGALTTDECAVIARELALLDGCFPRCSPMFLNDASATGATLLACLGAGGIDFAPSWRHAFSGRLMLAEAVILQEGAARRIASLEGRPWLELQKSAEALEAELLDSPNVILRAFMPGSASCFRALYHRLAHLRLLRVAAHWKATGEVLELGDPFGDTLKYVKSPSGLKVWSLGRDGIDYGGTGGWTLEYMRNLVLEVGP